MKDPILAVTSKRPRDKKIITSTSMLMETLINSIERWKDQMIADIDYSTETPQCITKRLLLRTPYSYKYDLREYNFFSMDPGSVYGACRLLDELNSPDNDSIGVFSTGVLSLDDDNSKEGSIAEMIKHKLRVSCVGSRNNDDDMVECLIIGSDLLDTFDEVDEYTVDKIVDEVTEVVFNLGKYKCSCNETLDIWKSFVL